jgi:hypothetical protein
MNAQNIAATPRSAPLTNYGISLDNESEGARSGVLNLYRLMRVQQEAAAPRRSMALCGRTAIESHVTLTHKKGYGHTFSCGSYLCVSCQRVSVKRYAPIIERALTLSKGYRFYFITLTQPSLKDAGSQISDLSGAFKTFSASFKRRFKRMGLNASILRAYDLTFRRYGKNIYPHVHIHGVIAVEKREMDLDVSEYAFELWQKASRKRELFVSKEAFYCEEIDTKTSAGAVSKYLVQSFSKVALETLSSNTKTPSSKTDRWNIPSLLAYIADNEEDGSAIQAYQDTILAFKNKKCVVIPPLFRELAGEEPVTEEEPAEDREEDNILVSKQTFKALRVSGMDIPVLIVALRGSKDDFNRLRNWIIDINMAFMCDGASFEDILGLMLSIKNRSRYDVGYDGIVDELVATPVSIGIIEEITFGRPQ